MAATETKTIVETVRRVFDANDKGWIDIRLGNDWKLSTKRAAIANQARQFEGQTAAVDYVEIQNGQYTNRYVEAVRQPAQHEVNGVSNLVNSETTGDTPARGTFTPGTTITPVNPRSEWQRSKEEMRFTAAMEIAAVLAPQFNADSLSKIRTLAQNIYATLEDGHEAPDPEFGF